MRTSTRLKLAGAVAGIAAIAGAGIVVAQSRMIRPPITRTGPLATPDEHAALHQQAVDELARNHVEGVYVHQNPRGLEFTMLPDGPGELTRGGGFVYDLDGKASTQRRYVRIATTTTGQPTIRISYYDCLSEILDNSEASNCDLNSVTWTYVAIPTPNTNLEIDTTADNDGVEITLRDRTTLQRLWVFNMATLIVRPPNRPPMCTSAAVTPNRLWPSNHQLDTVTIGGLSDPDNDPIGVNVTAVTQDEPVNGTGDGDTSQDAVLGAGSQLQIRADRAGGSDGRVYRIAFTATDGKGGSCTGTVRVSVRPNKNGTAVDSGGTYNSLRP